MDHNWAQSIRDISIHSYDYELPENKIAQHPLPNRSDAKLLIHHPGQAIEEGFFRDLSFHIPQNSWVILNDTKVIPARIYFQKVTGGWIEIFCLRPLLPMQEMINALQAHSPVTWQVMIGGLSKWKSGEELILKSNQLVLRAKCISRELNNLQVTFSWEPSAMSFSEVLQTLGEIPLPPYLARKSGAEDKSRYQTLMAKWEGSVAAPTAALHFDEIIFQNFSKKNIQTSTLTLHVGAGTFLPVKASTMEHHYMHVETVSVSKNLVEKFCEHFSNTDRAPLIAVGTTTLRSVESLYRIGEQLLHTGILPRNVSQWEVYDFPYQSHSKVVWDRLLQYFDQNKLEQLTFETALLIAPGFTFKTVDAIITNFHQPRSTLLLLVSAFIGNDWKKVYDYALKHQFRFLSYGDGSLLWRNNI